MANYAYYGQPLHEGLSLLTPPAQEPVSVDDVKPWCRVETGFTMDDGIIGGMITAARRYCETATKSQFITATYLFVLDLFPQIGQQWQWVGTPIRLPMPPLQSITSVQYLDSTGTLQTLASDKYTVDTVSKPGRIVPIFFEPWPVTIPQPNSVQITMVCGFGDDGSDVPQSYCQAISMLAAHYYRNREAVSDVSLLPVPYGVDALLMTDNPGIYM